jgi:hypothetical protein
MTSPAREDGVRAAPRGRLVPLLVALVVALWHVLWLGLYMAAYGGDPACLACVSDDRAGRPPYEAVRDLGFGDGYDGQFCYALAQAPFRRWDDVSPNPTPAIDGPGPRQLRVLYPALAWALTGGDKHALFWALPLVNVLAIGGLGWLGALTARDGGLSPWWGLLLPVAVNAGLAAFRDLTDPVSTFGVAALLVAWLRQAGPALVFITAAACLFSREQNVLAVAAVGAVAVVQRRWSVAAALVAAGLCWAGWFLHLWRRYDRPPLLPGPGNFAWPFSGPFFALTRLGGPDVATFLLNGFSLATLGSQFVLLAWMARRLRPDAAVLLTGLAFAGLALVGGEAIYEDRWSYLRVFAVLPLAVWLGCARAGRRDALLALALPILLAPATAFHVWCSQ